VTWSYCVRKDTCSAPERPFRCTAVWNKIRVPRETLGGPRTVGMRLQGFPQLVYPSLDRYENMMAELECNTLPQPVSAVGTVP
jgi:hypothetical protein